MALVVLRKVHKRIQTVWLAFFLMMFSAAINKRISTPTGQQLEDIKQSGFFGSKKSEREAMLYQKAKLAGELHANGKYHQAVDLHKKVLESVYEINNIDQSDWTPKFLSYNFGDFIGHRALVGIILAAQKIGLINQTNRILPYMGDENQQELEILFKNNEKIELIRADHGVRFLEGPLNWHLSERLWMIKTNEGFLEIQDFVDKVFRRSNELNISTTTELDFKYIEQAQLELTRLGLPVKKEFVALHVRKKTWNDFDVRQAKIENYRETVEELLRQGFYVVQIGTDPQVPIIDNKKVIVIQGNRNLPRFLTPYVLASSQFLINTSSGPSYLAALFGTPVLQTNVVAFGRSSPILSAKSIHIPKKWKHNGRELSLYELLSTPQGYSYIHINNLNKQGFELIENSSQEILAATMDILKMVRGNDLERFGMDEIKLIRGELQVPSNGDLAPSYISKNHTWFLPNLNIN